MRTRINTIAVYLLLSCMLFEHALPWFVEVDTISMCETKTETEGKDTKSGKDTVDEWKSLDENVHTDERGCGASFFHMGSLFADSDKIPDSAHRTIFSPPPNRA
ncbi:MAG: hypothetical protein ACKVU0_11735 [Saprospiraceae bacterium]